MMINRSIYIVFNLSFHMKELTNLLALSPNQWEVEAPNAYLVGIGFSGNSTKTIYNSVEKAQQRIAKINNYSEKGWDLDEILNLSIPDEIKEQFDKTQYIKKNKENWEVWNGHGMVDLQTGEEIGNSAIMFDNLGGAINEFLNVRSQNYTKASKKPVIVYEIKDIMVSFTDLENYNPEIIPTNIILEDSQLIKNLKTHEARAQWQLGWVNNIRKSFNEPNWYKQYINFIEKFLEGPGNYMRKQENITNLKKLTPRQALLISHDIAAYYKDYDIKEKFSKVYDQEKAIDVVNTKKNNGVCRTFAAVGKVFFNALKIYQESEYNKLTNTQVFTNHATIPEHHADLIAITAFQNKDLDICICDPTHETQGNKSFENYKRKKYAFIRSPGVLANMFGEGELIQKENLRSFKKCFKKYFEKVEEIKTYSDFGELANGIIDTTILPLIRKHPSNRGAMREVFGQEIIKNLTKYKKKGGIRKYVRNNSQIEIIYSILPDLESKKQFFDYIVQNLNLSNLRHDCDPQQKMKKMNPLLQSQGEIREGLLNSLYEQNQQRYFGDGIVTDSSLHWISKTINNKDEPIIQDFKKEIMQYLQKKKLK